MARSKKVTRHLSVRLVDDVAAAVADMASAADWSEGKVLNHLARVGLAFGESRDAEARALTGQFGQAVFERRVWDEAKATIAKARRVEAPDHGQMTLGDVIDGGGPAAVAAVLEVVNAERDEDCPAELVAAVAAIDGAAEAPAPAPTTAAEYFGDDLRKAPAANATASGRPKGARKPRKPAKPLSVHGKGKKRR